MGFNTTVVVLNDALNHICADQRFGESLLRATSRMHMEGRPQDIASGSYGNAATVIETHHADQTAIITVGGNMGVRQYQSFGWNHDTEEGRLRLLREWAESLGYSLHKKRSR